MKTLFFLLWFSLLQGAEWSLQDLSKGWNDRSLVSLYFHNSELQTQFALQALSHYTFRGDEKVLDFGSGDGRVSSFISLMVPKGKVTGVDISKEMVFYAGKMYPLTTYKNLSFSLSSDTDFQNATFETPFDLVTSFCVLHLVPNPSTLLTNIRKHLQPKGKLVMTYPIGGNLEFFQAAQEAMGTRGMTYPAATPGTHALRDPEKARTLISDAGFDITYFNVVDARQTFGSKTELIDWLEGTCTANWEIPPTERRLFFTDLVDRYLTLKPQDQDEDGFVYFNLKRIDLVASPK